MLPFSMIMMSVREMIEVLPLFLHQYITPAFFCFLFLHHGLAFSLDSEPHLLIRQQVIQPYSGYRLGLPYPWIKLYLGHAVKAFFMN